MPTANVVDVSQWQPTSIDWANLKANGVQAVIVRIGHGTTQDTNAADHISNATKAGLIVHVYHQYEGVDGEVAWSLTNANNLQVKPGSYYFLDVSKLQIDNLGDIFQGFYRNWLQAGYKVGIRCTPDQLSTLSSDEIKNAGIYRWTTSQSDADLWQMDGDNQGKPRNDVDQNGLLIANITQVSHVTDPNGNYPIKSGAFVGFDYSTTEVTGGKMLVASPDGVNKIPKLGPDGSFFFSQKDAQSMGDLVNTPKTLNSSDFSNGQLLADLENGNYYLSLEASQMPLDAPQGNNGYAILTAINANSYNGKQVLTDISGKSWTRVKASGFFKPWQDNSSSNKLRLTSDDGTNFFLTLSNSGEISTRKDLTDVVGSPDFDYQWGYSGDDLGTVFSKTSTKFSVWSPIADSVSLILYKDLTPDSEIDRTIEMQRGRISNPDNHAVNNVGVFSVEVEEDFTLGKAYQYELHFPNGVINTTQDIYSTAVTKGGDRSVVIDPASLVPANFNAGYSGRANLPSEVIVGETSVRDFTYNANSGVDENKRGKFLGMIQEGTKNPTYNKSTGFDYIKDLGINYIQIMPMFDSYSVSEDNWSNYNWGYDPKNYNVPEGAYATDSLDPKTPILELKQMIQKFHENNIGVVMDVVFNHIGGGATESSFGKTVPGYYFRLNDDGSYSNGSFCGNDIATEHEMMRKFIVESIKYWINSYGIDGFRFDLLGNIDTDTAKLIEDEVKKIDPRILLYGEGWNMPTKLADSEKTMQSNANQVSNIGFFNDKIRDGVGGNSDLNSPGFLSGNHNVDMIVNSMKGGQFGNSTYTRSSQLVQYLECHDDYTLTDKIWKYNQSDSPDIHGKRLALGLGILFASQGITFIQIGQEFWRNKQGIRNTYNSPDSVNDINWDYIGYHPDTIDLTKRLINLKRSNGLFRLDAYDYINQHLTFQNYQNGTGVISCTLKDDTAKFILFFNSSGSQIEIGKGSNSNWNGIYTYSDVDFEYSTSNVSNSANRSGSKVVIDDLGFAIYHFDS